MTMQGLRISGSGLEICNSTRQASGQLLLPRCIELKKGVNT